MRNVCQTILCILSVAITLSSRVEAQSPPTYCVVPSVPCTPPPADEPSSACDLKCHTCTGSPCYIASGVYSADYTDLRIRTASFPIMVGRNYSSFRTIDG